MSENREPGWYWVRGADPDSPWVPWEWIGETSVLKARWADCGEEWIGKVGGKIPSQCQLADIDRLISDCYGKIGLLSIEHSCMATFIHEAIDAAFAGTGLDGAWIQERAAALGILKAETYHPARHAEADHTLFEPGDTIYVRAPWLGARAGD